MLEYLKEIDLEILLLINSWHTPFLDKCMLVITGRNTWIPLYLFIIIFFYIKREKEFLLALLFIIAAVISADLFASSLMKPLFHRLRPCHNEDISKMLYLLKDICGGRYGFISSHAANTFAFSVFLFLYVGKEYKWVELFFIWASVVSISRVYLGVHYPADIGVGAIAGIIIGILFYYLYLQVRKKFFTTKS
jgi:undecaprenyl-diphosphatase